MNLSLMEDEVHGLESLCCVSSLKLHSSKGKGVGRVAQSV